MFIVLVILNETYLIAGSMIDHELALPDDSAIDDRQAY